MALILDGTTGVPVTTVTGTLPVANGGTGVTTKTGTGAVVLSTSPTLVTPLLGTPTSGNLANCTGIPAPAALTTASGSAPSYSARAWVNFNGVGTVAIRASGNVSSITDNGVGNYTVNLSTALPDTSASVLVSSGGMDNGINVTWAALGSYNSATNFILSTSQIRVYQNAPAIANSTDPYFFCMAVFR
jgi:hypothetical protein